MGENQEAAPAPADAPAPKPEAKPESFYLVVLDDNADEAPRVHRCDSEKEFANLVNEHVLSAKNPLYAFAFKGERIQISAPTSVCTVSVGGQEVPIGEKSTTFEETGRIVPLRNANE